ncbi:hypothetical protein HPHPH28_1472 [Helicobacter pylori Hp H-28]|nr:hypothetical protein HPHPH28_1472 [Helicobacter pylori Hp H-28]
MIVIVYLGKKFNISMIFNSYITWSEFCVVSNGSTNERFDEI